MFLNSTQPNSPVNYPFVMPLLIIPLVLLLMVLVAILMLPFTLRQRYRMGTARRRAYPWMVKLNAGGWLLSALGLLFGSWMATRWAVDALAYAAAGLAAGALLGRAGLALARFEFTPTGLFHTPNKWLVLAVTLVLAGRVAYSLWRVWHQTQLAGPAGTRILSLMHEHVGTLAAGGLLIGYYLVYEWGLRAKLKYVALRVS